MIMGYEYISNSQIVKGANDLCPPPPTPNKQSLTVNLCIAILKMYNSCIIYFCHSNE